MRSVASENRVVVKRGKKLAWLMLAAAPAAALCTQQSLAATDTWNGGSSSDSNWSDILNWNGSTVNSGDLLVFSGANRLTPNDDLAANFLINGITFGAGSGAFVLGGGAIDLGFGTDTGSGNVGGSGIVDSDLTATETIDQAITLSAGKHIISTGSSATSVLDLAGVITRSVGSTIQFTTNTGTINTTGTGLANDSSGILGGWATIGNNYATLNASGNVVAYTNYTGNTIATGAITGTTANTNLEDIASTGNFTAATGTLLNTLLIADVGTTARTLTVTGTMKFGTGTHSNGGVLRPRQWRRGLHHYRWNDRRQRRRRVEFR